MPLLESDPGAAAEQPALSAPAARFGVTALHPDRVDLGRSGASWYLNWRSDPTPGVELEFVPIVCAFNEDRTMSPAQLEALRAKAPQYPKGTLFVIGSEIGHPPQRDRRSAEQYPRDFGECRDVLLGADRSFQISTGPVILAAKADYVGASNGLEYLDQVLQAWQARHGEPLPADFIGATAHVLEGDGVDLDVFADQIGRFRRFLYDRGLAERRVLITEYGVAIGGADAEKRLAYMAATTRLLASARDEVVGCPADVPVGFSDSRGSTPIQLGPSRSSGCWGRAPCS